MSVLYAPPARASIALSRDIKAYLADIMSLNVVSVRVISASQGDDENPDPNQVYHAKLYLELGAEKLVLCFDPTPGAFMKGDRFWGVIMITEYATIEAATPEKSVQIMPKLISALITADLFKKLFDEEEMDKYLFTEGGTGCRHWCITALEKMIEWGYLHSETRTEIEEWERVNHDKLGDRFPVPRIRGDFCK